MVKRARAKKRPKVFWPSWRYGPDGEAGIFQREEDVPEGWRESPHDAAQPLPPLDPPPAPPPAAEPALALTAEPSVLERMRAVQPVEIELSDEEDDLPPAPLIAEPPRKLKRGRPKKDR